MFGPMAELYGLKYIQVVDRGDFREGVRNAISDRAPHLIERLTNPTHDQQTRQTINKIANS